MFPQHVLKPSQSLGICATAALISKRVDLFSVHAHIFKEFSTKHEVNSLYFSNVRLSWKDV